MALGPVSGLTTSATASRNRPVDASHRTLTIHGHDFDSTTHVLFGLEPAAAVRVESQDVMTVRAPAGMHGPVRMVVMTRAGMASRLVDLRGAPVPAPGFPGTGFSLVAVGIFLTGAGTLGRLWARRRTRARA